MTIEQKIESLIQAQWEMMSEMDRFQLTRHSGVIERIIV